MAPLWWVLAAVVLAVIEVVTVDLTFIMLAGGALSAALTSWLFGESNLWLQVGVFMAVSVILLFVVRPWAKRHIARHIPNVRTNADALIGRCVRTIEVVTTTSGYVSVGGQTWSARTHTGVIDAGEDVYITSIDGAIAIVSSHPVASPGINK